MGLVAFSLFQEKVVLKAQDILLKILVVPQELARPAEVTFQEGAVHQIHVCGVEIQASDFGAFLRPLLLGVGDGGLPLAHRNPGNQRRYHGRRRSPNQLVPFPGLLQFVGRARRARHNRLVREVALDVRRQSVDRLVATRPVLLQRLHNDPVEISTHGPRQLANLGRALCRHLCRSLAQLAHLGARFRWILFTDHLDCRIQGPFAKTLRPERCCPREQLIEHHPARGSCSPASRSLAPTRS